MEVIQVPPKPQNSDPQYPYVAWFLILTFTFWIIYNSYIEKENKQIKDYVNFKSIFFSALLALLLIGMAALVKI